MASYDFSNELCFGYRLDGWVFNIYSPPRKQIFQIRRVYSR